MPEFRMTDRLFNEAIQKPSVRAALARKARETQARADAIAAQEGEKLDSKVTEGTRPKGRPYARVSSTNVAQEYGTTIKERKRILGRAADGVA